MATVRGVNVTEGALGSPPIRLPQVSNIGIIGTVGASAAGKFAENGQPKYNYPFLITSRKEAADLGAGGTLPDALDGIFAQGRAKVVFSIVEEIPDGPAVGDGVASGEYGSEDAKFEVGNTDGSLTGGSTGIAPGGIDHFAFGSTFKGLSEIAKLQKGQVLVVQGRYTATDGSTDVLYNIGTYTVVRYELDGEGSAARGLFVTPLDVSAATGNFLATYNDDDDGSTAEVKITYHFTAGAQDGVSLTRSQAVGNQSEGTGVYGLLNAEAVTGVRPNLIMATGLGTGKQVGGNKNPLGAALETVATRLRAIALIAGPGTTHEEAVTAFASDYSSDRVYLIEPFIRVQKGDEIVDMDPTAHVAGVIVQNDQRGRAGWATSPSNQLINNVLGTSRPIDYVAGDPASRAQLLNDVGLATIINLGGGYRLWGSERTAAADRQPWKFLSVRRTADVLYQSVQDNHLWAVDKNIKATYFQEVSAGVNAFIRQLRSLGALYEGECYPDPDLNSEEAIKDGRAYFSVRYTPYYPARSLHFNVLLDPGPLGNILAA